MMAASGTPNGASALQTEFKSPEFDPDRAKQGIVSPLNPTKQSPSFEPSKSPSHPLPPDVAAISAAPKAEVERQSQSRSMSRTTSNASSSSENIIASHSQSESVPPHAEATTAPNINGASVVSSSSNVPVDLNLSSGLISDSNLHGDPTPNSASGVLVENHDEALDVLTPRDSPMPPAAQRTSDSRQTSTTVTSIPKARLPHDKIGIFEDRIKEDPRGDLEAWLGLIDEHKKRSRLDDARKVYDRFLKIFPNAVSPFSKS